MGSRVSLGVSVHVGGGVRVDICGGGGGVYWVYSWVSAGSRDGVWIG